MSPVIDVLLEVAALVSAGVTAYKFRRKLPPDAKDLLQQALDALLAIEGSDKSQTNLPRCPVCRYHVAGQGPHAHERYCKVGKTIAALRDVLHPGGFRHIFGGKHGNN